MKKLRQRLLIFLWIIAVIGTRILYLFWGQKVVYDTYGYFSNAMIQTHEKEPMLTSGLAYAYTGNLSVLFRFFGNSMEMVPIYQLVLQILWIILFFFGVRFIFGNAAGYVSATALAISPWMLNSIYRICAENYVMLFWSVELLLIAYFYWHTYQRGWYRNNICEIVLILIGGLLGILCIWNYLSWLLLIVLVYILIRNHRIVKDKFWLQRQEDLLKEENQLMPIITQTCILLLGLFAGMVACLLRFTGLTGWTIMKQFDWWIKQYEAFPGRCQDVDIALLWWILGAMLSGIFVQLAVNGIKVILLRKKALDAEKQCVEKTAPAEEAKESEKQVPEAKEPEVKEPEVKEPEVKEPEVQEPKVQEPEDKEPKVTPEKTKKVKLLDNPLPVPPRHVSKTMDFDFTDMEGEKADFDVKLIDKNDDFEI